MTQKTAFFTILGALLLAVCLGCTPSRQHHHGCRVSCKYCAPAPLPYFEYHGCPCHSCAAEKYLSLPPQSVERPTAAMDNDEQPD